MLNFFRKQRHAPNRSQETGRSPEIDVETDAAQRAGEFWRRWAELLPEVSAALGDGVPRHVDHLLVDAIAVVHHSLVISIERGTEAVYALVVSSQADPRLRVYTDAWIAGAPRADSTWEYHDAIPPVPDPTQVTLNLRGEQYPLDQVRLAPQVDSAAGLIDVAVHHPGFSGLDTAAKEALTFMPLDAALGERLAADRIGRVESADVEPQGAIGLREFRDLVREWDGTDPGGSLES